MNGGQTMLVLSTFLLFVQKSPAFPIFFSAKKDIHITLTDSTYQPKIYHKQALDLSIDSMIQEFGIEEFRFHMLEEINNQRGKYSLNILIQNNR